MTIKQKVKLDVFADGASKGNPGKGGWGYVILGTSQKALTNYGGARNVTNNQMELQAVIEALKELQEVAERAQIRVFTDSTYVQKGISEWIKNWKKNGWKTAAKKPVKNEELWRELDHLQSLIEVEWHWVKGHAGNKYNEMADDLANMGAASV